MFQWNRIAACFIVSAAMATTAAAQPHKGGGGGGGAPPGRGGPAASAPQAAPAARPAPAPHSAPAPRAAPAPQVSAPRPAPQASAPRPAPQVAAPRHAPPQAAAPRAAPPRAAPQQSARPSGGPGASATARHGQQQPQMTGRGGRDGARVAQPTPRENVTRQGGPGGASGAATSGRGGRNADPQQNVVPQQGVTQQNQQQGASQQNRTSRTAPPPAQNIAPQQGQRNQQDVIPQNQVSRAIPASAPRARAASDPRAFSGGVLRNQAFANLATARDPSVRTLASSTFQGRLFNPHWRRHFKRPIVIGWVGPLFWPYAYYDFVDYTFYPYAYDTFWPYAYDDFYEGMFGAYGLGYGGTYASVGPRGGYDGGGYARRGSDRTAYARGSAGSRSVEADLCSGQTAGLTDWPIERIAQTVGPDDTQRAILDELRDATARALDILQAACPTALPSTPTGRIEAMRQRLDAMLAAVRTVRPVVEKFYQSLNDEQKARFNALSPDNPDQQQAQRNLTQVCGERASGIASVPLERIERAVRPDGAQRSALKELQDATSEAANLLSAECPTYRALTPVGRLQAMEQRLDAMLRAVQTVQPALEKFYGSLGDEQKERFNRLSPAQG
jgi:histone H3/H4